MSHSEVEPYQLTGSEMAEFQLYDPDLDFKKLFLESEYGSRGFLLVEKKDLVGIPHIIIGVTYREGMVRPNGDDGDYVSLEAVVAPQEVLDNPAFASRREGRELRVYGNQAVVYNDGSTGIRRDMTRFLHSDGLINIGTTTGELSDFDRSYHYWEQGASLANRGIFVHGNGKPFRYRVLGGLRASDYEWEDDKGKKHPATTYYLS